MLLYHHWVRDEEIFAHERLRVQLAANLILAGATATRPGALIGQLLYERLEFQLFSALSVEVRPRVVMKVYLKHIKRSGGISDPKEFAFREDDMLIYDPLIPIMAMALADDAFLNGFTDPQEIYDLIVPKNSDHLRILWKDEWRQRAVFRDIERTTDGVQIALEKARRWTSICPLHPSRTSSDSSRTFSAYPRDEHFTRPSRKPRLLFVSSIATVGGLCRLRGVPWFLKRSSRTCPTRVISGTARRNWFVSGSPPGRQSNGAQS